MTPDQKEYTEFARSLDGVNEREERTQIVFSISGHNFCWISKNNGGVQLFPSLGNRPNATRTLERKGRSTLCLRSSNGNVDAQYDDPDEILKPLWSYVGFRVTDCSFEYGCDLIRQAHAHFHGRENKIRQNVSTPGAKNTSLPQSGTVIVNNAEPEPLDVAVKNVMIELEQILAKFEPKSERSLYQWITELQAKGVIPRPVADMMHTIRTLRNNVAHSNHLFNKHDRTVLESAWLSVQEWCAQKCDH